MGSTNKVISLFSGAGGMDIGFQQAGFDIAVAVEADSSCCNTLRKNCPKLPVIEGDITTIQTAEILRKGHLSPLDAALVIGGPPCQSFSLAGRRMGLNDERGMLVLEFARVVREALPVAFVMENVKGMVNWQNGKALDAVLGELTEPILHEGKTYQYDVSYDVLNASHYGVPQHRERLFIVGNRIHKGYSFPRPTHGEKNGENLGFFDENLKPVKTVRNALKCLPKADEPSEAARRVSKTIKDRIKNHGY